MIDSQGRKLCGNCFSKIESECCENCGFSESEYSPDNVVLPVGTMLQNRYRIGGVIGKGGFGVMIQSLRDVLLLKSISRMDMR